MEANFFRALAPEIAHDLAQARIGKVYAPEDGIWTFSLNKPGRRPFLLFRPAKADGLLFVSDRKPENPATPSAHAMWYRKRLAGRFIRGHAVDWPGLRLALELSPGPGRYIVFSLREGVRLTDELDQDFGREPEWPDPENILDNPAIWRTYPQISPPLRKILAALPRSGAQALLASLQQPATGFYLGYRDELPIMPSAWPLIGFPGQVDYFDSALKAAAAAGEPQLYPLLAALESQERTAAGKAQRKKLRRSLVLMKKDRERLQGLCALQRQAEALQSQMYRFSGDAASPLPKILRVTHPDGEELDVALDPQRGLSANLEMLFRKAAKGERGLKIVAQREQLLLDELNRLQGGAGGISSTTAETTGDASVSSADLPMIPKKYEKLAVRLFRSSDGFLLVRGRNAKANHQLLSMAASPFDYWFHAKDVPGAHVVLRRDHPRQEVPEQSLRQAAILAALSSKAATNPKAEVICAQVRDVRKIKGAHLGMVRVENIDRVLYVDLDSSLEESLAWAGR